MRRRSTSRGRQGDHLVVDDRSGMTFWASETQKEWTGALVAKRYWEARHPQDFVRGVKDNLRVDPARTTPLPNDLPQIGPFRTTLVENSAAGDDAFVGADMSGFRAGDWVRIYLDNGDAFTVRIVTLGITIDDIDVPIDDQGFSIDADGVILSSPLPWPASIGNAVVNISNVSGPDLVL